MAFADLPKYRDGQGRGSPGGHIFGPNEVFAAPSLDSGRPGSV